MDDQGIPDVGERVAEDETRGNLTIARCADTTLITDGGAVVFYGSAADAEAWLESNSGKKKGK